MADATTQIFNDFQSLPNLVASLANGIVDAQIKLDAAYVDNLGRFKDLVAGLKGANGALVNSQDFQDLFNSIGPARYEFTQTSITLHADIQLASEQEINIGGNVGLNTTVLAAAVTFSYMNRSSGQFQGSTDIQCTLNVRPTGAALQQRILSAPAATGTSSTTAAGTAASQDSFKQISSGLDKIFTDITFAFSDPLNISKATGSGTFNYSLAGGSGPYAVAAVLANGTGVAGAAGATADRGSVKITLPAAPGATLDFVVFVQDKSDPPKSLTKMFTITITA